MKLISDAGFDKSTPNDSQIALSSQKQASLDEEVGFTKMLPNKLIVISLMLLSRENLLSQYLLVNLT